MERRVWEICACSVTWWWWWWWWYTYIYIYTHTHTYMYIYLYTHIYTYMKIYIYIYIYMYIYIYTHTHIFINIHTNIHDQSEVFGHPQKFLFLNQNILFFYGLICIKCGSGRFVFSLIKKTLWCLTCFIKNNILRKRNKIFWGWPNTFDSLYTDEQLELIYNSSVWIQDVV